MDKKKKRTLTGIRRNITSIVSVAMVLLILGIVATMALGVDGISRQLKQSVGFDVVMLRDATQQQIDSIAGSLQGRPEVESIEVLSSDDILNLESEDLDIDILEVVGENPYSAEIHVKMTPESAIPDVLHSVADQYTTSPGVEQVDVIDRVVEVAGFIKSLTIILLVVAVSLILISFVLISNTVKLAIYANRFLLHTMQLVGATGSFIRRPIVRGYCIYGIIAAVIAIGLLAALRFYAESHFREAGIELAEFISWSHFIIVAACMMVCGVLLCSLSAIWATNRYLRKNFDELF